MKLFRRRRSDRRTSCSVSDYGRNRHNRRLTVEPLEDRRMLATVFIDPAAYTGVYSAPDSGTVNQSGVTSWDLDPGTYSIRTGFQGLTSSSFDFSVDSSGNITNVSNPDAVEFAGNTVTFKNAVINFQPGNYSGNYQVDFATPSNGLTGPASVVVLPNFGWQMRVGFSGTISFFVDANGDVTNNQNPQAVQFSGDTITFNNATVTVDPDAYLGNHSIDSVAGASQGNSLTTVVVPNLNYQSRIGLSGTFSIFVDENGNVVSGSEAAQGDGDTLTLNNTSLCIDPNNFPGEFDVTFVHDASGATSYVLVPSVGYLLRIFDSGAILVSEAFSLDANGQPNPNAVSFVFDGEQFGFTLTAGTCNLPPTLDPIADTTLNEGSTLSVIAAATDPDEGDTLQFSLDDAPSGASIDPDTGAFSWSPSEGPTTADVTVRVTDEQGEFDTESFQVTVNNVAPMPTITTISATVVDVATPITFDGAFTDPGALDLHSAEWTLESTSIPAPITISGAVVQGSGSGTVSGSTTLDTPGVYHLSLTVTDDDGDAGTANTIGGVDAMIVVYDPSGGFVTGGGWIDSPAGAFAADPTLTGKASFGFVSKYQQGATVPTGQTEFRFRLGDLNFHSSDYDWLVVAGSKAKFKGTGTINGQGNYGFMVTATDGALPGGGGEDKFRIKIWDKDNNDAIIYDNQLGDDDDADPTTLLGGGQIVIHKD